MIRLLALTLTVLVVIATGSSLPKHLTDFTVDEFPRCQKALQNWETDAQVISCGLAKVDLEEATPLNENALENFCTGKCHVIYQVVLEDLSRHCYLGPVAADDFARLNHLYVAIFEAVCSVDSSTGQYCVVEARKATGSDKFDVRTDEAKKFLCSGQCGIDYAGPAFTWRSRVERLLSDGKPEQFEPKKICERSSEVVNEKAVRILELLHSKIIEANRDPLQQLPTLRSFFLNWIRKHHSNIWERIFEKDNWKLFESDTDYYVVFADKFKDFFEKIETSISPKGWEALDEAKEAKADPQKIKETYSSLISE